MILKIGRNDRTRRLGKLAEGNSLVVFPEHTAAPGADLIARLTENLKIGSVHRNDRESITERNSSDTVSYVNLVIKEEGEYLVKNFVCENKYFTVLVLMSRDGDELNIIFRLRTVGLEGSTQYRLSWRRISKDKYACSFW